MLKFFALLAAGYALVLVAIYLMQGRMLYLPNVPGRALAVPPNADRLDYEDVSIETDDGVTLHGWFVPGSLSSTTRTIPRPRSRATTTGFPWFSRPKNGNPPMSISWDPSIFQALPCVVRSPRHWNREIPW